MTKTAGYTSGWLSSTWGAPRLLVAIALLTAFGCAAPVQQDAPLGQSDELSASEQTLSADPGPKTLFVGGSKSRPSRLDDARSDGTYVYFHFYSDQDRYCWGRVWRAPVGGGTAESVAAPCFTLDFAIGNGGVYFSVLRNATYSAQSSGIYHISFGLNDLTILTTVEASSIAADASYVYWNGGTALHRMLPDGTGDIVLAADAASSTLLIDDRSVYGSDGAGVWKVPKNGGARVALTTTAIHGGGLILDRGELFWFDNSVGRIERLSIIGGTPRTFYETAPYDVQTGRGLSGLGVAGGFVYWSADGELRRRAKMGGAVATIVTDEVAPRVLAADATNVYYSRVAVLAPPWQELRRMPVADIVAPACGDKPRRVADAVSPLGLAAAGSWIYYTEGDTVRRVWKNGGSVETVATNQPGARALHASTAVRAWVTDMGVNSMGSGPQSVPKLYAAEATNVISGPSGPAELYYTDGARIVGPADTTLATGLAPYRLAGDESWLYFTDRGDQTLSRVPRAGGSVELLARVSHGEIGDLDLDSDDVFFSVDRGKTGTILRVPKAGGTVALVARGAFSPLDIKASDSDFFLYFSSEGPSSKTVYRVAKRGGNPDVRVKGVAASELDTLGRCVFYATDAGIDVVSKF